VTVMADGKPIPCRSAGANRAVLKTLSIKVRLIGYNPDTLNCGTVSVKSKMGLSRVPPVIGRLPRPKGLRPVVSRISMLPFPVDPLPKPLRSSVAAICTVIVAGPPETFTVVGLMLNVNNWGGVVSAPNASRLLKS
jgi:hypothetical protein